MCSFFSHLAPLFCSPKRVCLHDLPPLGPLLYLMTHIPTPCTLCRPLWGGDANYCQWHFAAQLLTMLVVLLEAWAFGAFLSVAVAAIIREVLD